MDLQILSEYLEFLEVERGLSKNTIDAYRRDLSEFLEFCISKNVEELQKIDNERTEAHPLRNGEVSHNRYSTFGL